MKNFFRLPINNVVKKKARCHARSPQLYPCYSFRVFIVSDKQISSKLIYIFIRTEVVHT
jgi:hypothetical protein